MEKRIRTEIKGLGEISYVQKTSNHYIVSKGVLVYEDGGFRSRTKKSIFIYQDNDGKITVYYQLTHSGYLDHYDDRWQRVTRTIIYSDCEIMDPIKIRSTHYYKVKDSDIEWVRSLIKPENIKPPERYEKRLPYIGKISYEKDISPCCDIYGKIIYDTFFHKVHIDKSSNKEGIVIYHTYRLLPFFVAQTDKYTKCRLNKIQLEKI